MLAALRASTCAGSDLCRRRSRSIVRRSTRRVTSSSAVPTIRGRPMSRNSETLPPEGLFWDTERMRKTTRDGALLGKNRRGLRCTLSLVFPVPSRFCDGFGETLLSRAAVATITCFLLCRYKPLGLHQKNNYSPRVFLSRSFLLKLTWYTSKGKRLSRCFFLLRKENVAVFSSREVFCGCGSSQAELEKLRCSNKLTIFR